MHPTIIFIVSGMTTEDVLVMSATNCICMAKVFFLSLVTVSEVIVMVNLAQFSLVSKLINTAC